MANVTNHGQNVSETITGKYFTFIVNSELLISNESRWNYFLVAFG